MVRIVFGTDLPSQGQVEVDALTLGQALAALALEHSWVNDVQLRAFVGGVDAARLEDEHTPLGPEETILVTRRPSRG